MKKWKLIGHTAGEGQGVCGPGPHEAQAYTASPLHWPALCLWTEAPVPSPSVICPPPPGPAKGTESQSPATSCRSGLEMWLPVTGFSRAEQSTLTRKHPFPERAGVTHQSSVLAPGSQAGHRFSFPITGSATWPNSASFSKGPVYSLHCQMVAAFSSADMIVEFLQLPISNYRNISVEGNRANWPAATVPATSQISSPGFHLPGAELQRGGYDMVVRHWRNSPAMIFLFVKTFHLQYLFCFTLFNNKFFFFAQHPRCGGKKQAWGNNNKDGY